MSRSYWAMRVDKAPEPLRYIVEELHKGRLRQGWGYSEDQDLREVSRTKPENRSKEQQDAWRHRRFLSTKDGVTDGMKQGDLILIPNTPELKRWSLVEITDEAYHYDFQNSFRDYGHIRNVRLLNPDNPINPQNEAVHSRLRGTMRNPGRLWNIDVHSEYVDILLREMSLDSDLSDSRDETRSLDLILTKMRDSLWSELDRNFRGAEFEKPCLRLFEAIYDTVEHTGGPSERGADFICTSIDPLGISHSVAIQVKKWDGLSDLKHPLEQIVVARQNYGDVNAAAIFTTLETVTEDAEREIKLAETNLGIPIAVLTREDVLNLFLKYLPDFQIAVLE